MEQQRSTIEVFCCYAHKDEHLLDELKRHVSPLRRQQLIDVWHDRDSSAGTEWKQEIEKHLNKAHIILLLINPDCIHSEYCYSTELKRALERYKRGEARVIPVILRPVDSWEKVPPGDIQLGQLQALPKDAKPITSWTDHDEAWKDYETKYYGRPGAYEDFGFGFNTAGYYTMSRVGERIKYRSGTPA
jgi:TIR domain